MTPSLQTQVIAGCHLYKSLPSSLWQNIDSKVSIWSLEPQRKGFFTYEIIVNFTCSFFQFFKTNCVISLLYWMMTFIINLVLLSSWTALVFALPHNAFDKILKGPRGEFESSGNRPHEPIQGIVKVLELDPALTLKGFLRSGQAPRRSPSLGSRLSYPAFLSQRHPGPALTPRTLATPLNHLQTKTPTETELKKRQGLQMWQRAINKGGMIAVSLPVNLKETKQTCTPMPFTQVRCRDLDIIC